MWISFVVNHLKNTVKAKQSDHGLLFKFNIVFKHVRVRFSIANGDSNLVDYLSDVEHISPLLNIISANRASTGNTARYFRITQMRNTPSPASTSEPKSGLPVLSSLFSQGAKV